MICDDFANKNTHRKSSTIPYIVHPLDVASPLMKNNAPNHVVIAGLLHDVVEDEDYTLSDIRDEFGDEVATLVDGAFEPEELINADEGTSKTWPERKAHTIDFIKNADRDMKLLSCADKLANIRDIIRDYDRAGGLCVGYLQCLKGLGCMVLHFYAGCIW